MERYISKFLVNGDDKPEPVDRSYGSNSFAPRENSLSLHIKYGNHSSFRSCNPAIRHSCKQGSNVTKKKNRILVKDLISSNFFLNANEKKQG